MRVNEDWTLGSRSWNYIYKHSGWKDGHGHKVCADKLGWSCMLRKQSVPRTWGLTV